jgi:hypothetical protein
LQIECKEGEEEHQVQRSEKIGIKEREATVMQELNRLDRRIEGDPSYSNTRIAEMHRDGLLSRAEAEALDIMYTGFIQDQEDDRERAAVEDPVDQWEPSFVAIVHEGTVIPIIDLGEIMQRPVQPQEQWAICKQAASILYDVLLTFLGQEGGGRYEV